MIISGYSLSDRVRYIQVVLWVVGSQRVGDVGEDDLEGER